MGQELVGGIGEKFEVTPETVGEFTELKDKNQKEIWENDVVKTKYGLGVVKFWFGSFVLKYGKRHYLLCSIKRIDREIIGNIHEASLQNLKKEKENDQ